MAHAQRRDSARPVGNRKKVSANSVGMGWNIEVVNQAATWPPGRDPGWRTRVQSTYSLPIPNAVLASPEAVKTNQIRFSGRRHAITAPVRAKTTAWME